MLSGICSAYTGCLVAVTPKKQDSIKLDIDVDPQSLL
jgi:hypothetical protein